MKVNINKLRMCQACGQWSNNCSEYRGETLCPICKQFEIEHKEDRDKEIQLNPGFVTADSLGDIYETY